MQQTAKVALLPVLGQQVMVQAAENRQISSARARTLASHHSDACKDRVTFKAWERRGCEGTATRLGCLQG